MACFWTGLISALKLTIQPHELAKIIKEKNMETRSVLWNGEELSEKMHKENVEWVNSINPAMVHHGYDCSVCDPVLFLIAQIYNSSIVHNYNGILIKYTNKYHGDNVIYVRSDRGHFWNGK